MKTSAAILVIFLIAVGWSTVAVNGSEEQPRSSCWSWLRLRLHSWWNNCCWSCRPNRYNRYYNFDPLADIADDNLSEDSFNFFEPVYQLNGFVRFHEFNEYEVDELNEHEHQHRYEQHDQLGNLKGNLKVTDDIWTAVGLSTSFCFAMVLTLLAFRSLKKRRKSGRKINVYSTDTLGGATNSQRQPE